MRGYQSNAQPARESSDTRQKTQRNTYRLGILREKEPKCEIKTPTHASREASFINAKNMCLNPLRRERFRIIMERGKENFKRKVRPEQLRLIAGRSSR
jgi:hypothetical protein